MTTRDDATCCAEERRKVEFLERALYAEIARRRAAVERALYAEIAGGRQMLADLRAQVEALRDEAMDHERATGEPAFASSIVAYQTVLALLGGESDGA